MSQQISIPEENIPNYIKYAHHQKRKTLGLIAEELGFSRAKVSRLCKKHGINVYKFTESYIDPSKYGCSSHNQLKNKLITLHNDGLSQGAIAKKLSCSRKTVIELFKLFGIKIIDYSKLHNKCGFASEEALAQEFSRLYLEKCLSKKEIAQIFHINSDSVAKILKRYNVPSRTVSQTLSLTLDDFEPTTEESQIITGILLAGGQLNCLRYTAYLSLKNNKSILKVIENELYRFCPSINNDFFKTKSYPYFLSLAKLWCADIPKIKLTQEVCYWWHLIAGISEPNRIIYCGFSEENANRLLNLLPINAGIITINSYCISIETIEERRKFLRFIGPCRHPQFAEKWYILNSQGEDLGY